MAILGPDPEGGRRGGVISPKYISSIKSEFYYYDSEVIKVQD